MKEDLEPLLDWLSLQAEQMNKSDKRTLQMAINALKVLKRKYDSAIEEIESLKN